MLTSLKQFLQKQQLKIKTLAAVAACCFAMGLALPAGMQWLKPAPPAAAANVPFRTRHLRWQPPTPLRRNHSPISPKR